MFANFIVKHSSVRSMGIFGLGDWHTTELSECMGNSMECYPITSDKHRNASAKPNPRFSVECDRLENNLLELAMVTWQGGQTLLKRAAQARRSLFDISLEAKYSDLGGRIPNYDPNSMYYRLTNFQRLRLAIFSDSRALLTQRT